MTEPTINKKPAKKKKAYRSGFISLTGRPNVGKSTFLNTVLGQKISIVSSKPQTTRNRIIGVKTTDQYQAVFVDSPGIHAPKHGLGAFMVKEAYQAVKDVDVIVLMVEPKEPTGADRKIITALKGAGKPLVLLINKVDTIKKNALLPVLAAYDALHTFAAVVPVSALKNDGLDLVLKEVVALLPEGDKLYPDDTLTDSLERFMVAEIVREKIMEATEQEVPHSTAAEVFQWAKEGKTLRIGVNIYIEKPGQKAIIIGKAGALLKEIGTAARADIETLLGEHVFLELFVKLKKDWRTDRATLKDLGFV